MSKEYDIPYEITQYGFKYGSAEITRTFSSKKDGSITLTLATPKGDLQIYITRTGKIRIWDYYAIPKAYTYSSREWSGTLTAKPKEK